MWLVGWPDGYLADKLAMASWTGEGEMRYREMWDGWSTAAQGHPFLFLLMVSVPSEGKPNLFMVERDVGLVAN